MIRKLLATTALVTITAGGAQAAERFLSASDDAAMASTIIGETVYVSSADDAESVGEINDLLVGSDGQIDAAIVGVGGFLGIGEKDVAVSYDNLTLTTDDDGTQHVVLETSKEELEAAPEFDVSAVTAPDEQKQAMAPEGQADDRMAAEKDGDKMAGDEMEKAGEETAAATNDTMTGDDKTAAEKETMASDRTMAPAEREAIAAGRQEYAIVDVATMGTDELIGANVYSYNNDNLGEIGEIVLTDDGKTDAVIIDVGGFLGLGEKPVAVAFEDLEFRADEGGTLYVYTQFTEDQLDAAAEYDEDEYMQSRDQMRVRSAG